MCPLRGKSVSTSRVGKATSIPFPTRHPHKNIPHHTSSDRLLILGTILLGLALRWPLWTAFRFREDEALYAHWAWLIYSHIDPMLQSAPVDKPPLFPYLLARTFTLLGPSEIAARWPNLLAGGVSLPLLYTWARSHCGPSTARRALFIYAILPLSILLTPTAYTDTLMVGWLLLAMALALPQRPFLLTFLSGVALGAAIATKPFALLWFPLLLVEILRKRSGTRFIGWTSGVAIPLWHWWSWEHLRGGTPTIIAAVHHYGGFRLLSAEYWIPRALTWGGVFILTLGGLPLLFLLGGYIIPSQHQRTPRYIRFLWGWLFTVWFLYLSTNLQPWDRYLLVVMPVVALLMAYGWERTSHWISGEYPDKIWAIEGIIIVLLLWTGIRGGTADYPVGGDHGAYDGIDAVSAYVATALPQGGILYHHWLGWHYGFYLFAAPYDYRWWPTPSWLAQDAARPDGIPRILVFPAWHERERQTVMQALHAANVQVHLMVRVYDRHGTIRFYVYTLSTGPSRQTNHPSRAQDPQMPIPQRITRAQES